MPIALKNLLISHLSLGQRDANSNAGDSSLCHLSFFQWWWLPVWSKHQTFLSSFGHSTGKLSRELHYFHLLRLNSGSTQERGSTEESPWGNADYDGGFAVIPLIEAFSLVMKYSGFFICAYNMVNISVTWRHRLVLVTWGRHVLLQLSISP